MPKRLLGRSTSEVGGCIVRSTLFVIYKKSSIIHEESTKEITTLAVSLYVIKAHVYFDETFVSIFSIYTTSILKIISQTN